MNGALEGIRVLDLTQVLAGPFCTMLLADHGADVIKIEAPQGDLTRSIGPFLADDTARRYSGYYQSVNRNKRGMVLDLKSERDRARFLAMVERVDVVAENFRVGVMDRLGLGYETLRARNPRLVYAAIRGFGDPRTGASPYAEWPAFDIVAQAMGGFLGITGPGVPMKAGPGIGDIVPGMLCAFGILAAVRHAAEEEGWKIEEGDGDGGFDLVGKPRERNGRKERLVVVRSSTEDLEILASWLATRELRTVVDRTLPLASFREAFERLESRRTRGKIVIEVSPN